MEHKGNYWYGTTILAIRTKNEVIIGGDGQVSMGHCIVKGTANKLRRFGDDENTIITGFAGATADAFTLLERLKDKLEAYPKQLMRACVELAKDWRTDKYLRRLEAMIIVANLDTLLVISGNGDVLEPEDGIVAIGSGGNYALSAAKALKSKQASESGMNMNTEQIVRLSLSIAADICIYTNHNIRIEKIIAKKIQKEDVKKVKIKTKKE